MAAHSQRSNYIYAFQLSRKSTAGLKASWTAYCVVPHHWSELIHENHFENYRADSNLSTRELVPQWTSMCHPFRTQAIIYFFGAGYLQSYAFLDGSSGCLAFTQAASSDACIIDSRWYMALSTLVSISTELYSLTFMSQVKAFDTLSDDKLLRHHFIKCIWTDHRSWILSFPSVIMNSCWYNIIRECLDSCL